ncbi:NACHT and WD repeat domain-containing protein [Aspergillus foveolatus]|uniref:NACHT and WD repeat domain-containing protein n=1 Tax=Aspergillus foveolatus TaxID=210207 RepID=UPI003CCE138D
MADTPAGSVCRKRDVFRRLKSPFRGSSKERDTPPISRGPSTLELTTSPYAKSGLAGSKINDLETDNNNTKDYWQMAYNELTESDRNTLAIPFLAAATNHQEAGRGKTKEILEKVVKATEAQYKEDQNKNGIRANAFRIINSALMFAWAIVSLGLTMAKNHADLRDALFKTLGYLADLLTRCAFIEEQFYRGPAPVLQNAEKERSIVRVYVAILQYSAEVRKIQEFGTAKDIVESITGVASKQLAQLKTLIKEEELQLHQWLLLDEHLHRKAEAEAILTQIDKLAINIKKVDGAVMMSNLPFVDGALFDSFEDQKEDECLPGTRQELLQQVQDWGRSGDRGIFWLSGMAGTGKSTIARTAARTFKADGVLGASFFFKRGRGDRSSAAKLFPTIVKQLAVHIPQMKTGVQKAIDDDPTIGGKSLEEQFKKLLLQPLLAVGQDKAVSSTLVVIDALDECEPKEDVKTILVLLTNVMTATNMAIRFFFTSRPEQPIRISFEQIGHRHYQHTPLHKVDDNIIKHDIIRYLTQKFSEIQQSPEHGLPHGWPGEEQIKTLAMRAAPLFIFAATVCRFVADDNFDPNERLQEFLTNSSGSKLDDTYRPVLKQLLVKDKCDRDKLIAEFQKIISVIILLATPLSQSSLAELLGLQERNISIRLRSFHSVLIIPSDPNLPIQTFHSSFYDYLLDEGTKTDTEISRFWVDKGEKHELIARQCLTVMGRYLKKNICGKVFLPPALQYTCRYWVYHLTQGSLSAKTIDWILPFLEEHFLHWLEVMAILGIISECLNAVDTLLMLTKDNISSTALSLFLSDARRYIHKFIHIVDIAPLQLYSAGLIFAPQEALIRTSFSRELPDWLYRAPMVEENWSPELQTLEGHSNWFPSVAFSPDGRLLATIKLWDPATGALKHTLGTHSIITDIKFSKQLPQLITNQIPLKKWQKYLLQVGGLLFRVNESYGSLQIIKNLSLQ